MTWRNRLRQASFRGVPFHVEDSDFAGGRRIAPHDYPKRDTGYAEDMGRRLRLHRIRGYVVGPNYDVQLRVLIAALEAPGPGLLIRPTLGEHLVAVEQYGAVESREEGGYATVDMAFIEAGMPVAAAATTDTGAAVDQAGAAAGRSSKGAVDNAYALPE